MINSLCPCNSQLPAHECCLPIIEGKINALTAEQLMRSRYTAFTMAHVDYLMKSHHPKTRPIKEKKNMKRWAQSVQWIGLKIMNIEKGGPSDTKGTVTFKALFIENGKPDQIYETSYFEKLNNYWVYVNGTHN
jgi:SEC-C motif-containing protein